MEWPASTPSVAVKPLTIPLTTPDPAAALCSAQPQRFELVDPGVVQCNPGAVRLRLRRAAFSRPPEWLGVQGESLATGLRLVVEPADTVVARQVWQLGQGRGGTYQLRHRDSGGWLSVLWDGSIEHSAGQITSWSPQMVPNWIMQPVVGAQQPSAAGPWLTLSYWTSGKRLAAAEWEEGLESQQSSAQALSPATQVDSLPTAWLVSPTSQQVVPWTQQWRLEDVAGQPCRLP